MYEEHSFKAWLIDYQTLSLSLASVVFFFDVKYYVGIHQTNGQASLLIEKIENDKKIRFFYHLNYCCCAVLVIMKQISILAQYDKKLL